MNINNLRKRGLIMLMAVVLLPVSLAGCGTEFESLALELLQEWAGIHDIDPTTPGGAVNLAKRAASDTTGDEDADAAIGLVKVARDIEEGDKLMAEGRQQRNAEKMDAAIAKRPTDWTYRVSRSALAFNQNDAATARKQQEAAWLNFGFKKLEYNTYRGIPWVDPTGSNYNRTQMLRFHNQNISELESGTANTATMDKETKLIYYSSLFESSQALFWMTGESNDRLRAEQYRELIKQTESS